MEKTLVIIDSVLKLGFFVFFVLLFCRSVHLCFWTEKKSKVKLFFLAFFSSPLLTFIGSLLLMDLLGYIFYPESVVDTKRVLEGNAVATIMYSAEMVLLYMMLILVCVWLVGKWLGTLHKQALLFLYLMFNTITMLSLKGSGNGAFSDPKTSLCIDITECLILFAAAWLFYRLDVRALSDISKRRIKAEVKWSVFTVPPAVFIILYTPLSILMAYYDAMNDGKMILAVYIFSTVIIFLFIWVFYVIIRNINATNEAVLAKDVVKALSVEVMEALAHTIDAKDEYTRGHSVRVANYSRMIAEKMGMPPEDCENVYYMGLLHDLGKIGVPNEIINSPTKLTDEQYEVIKTHPGLGYEILSEIKSSPDLVMGARWHHERYDGTGYPDHKSGKGIPLMARIIAVADSYDAMTSNRSYRKYLEQEKVKEELRKNKGTQFDPEIAEVMIAIIDEDKDYKLHE